MSGSSARTPLTSDSGLPVGVAWTPMNTACWPFIATLEVQLCAPRSTLAMSSSRTSAAVGALDHHALELVDVGQAGVGIDVGDREDSLWPGPAPTGSCWRGSPRHVGGGDAARRHCAGIEPQPHRKGLAAEDIGRGDAVDRRQQRLHDPGQVVGDRRGSTVRRCENPIYMTAVVWPVDFRMTGSCACRRHQVFDLLHLGHDVGQRLARVVIQLDIGGDGAGALDRARGQVVDALGGRDRLLDRRRDKALDQVGRRAGIGGRDRDRRVEQPRILPDLQARACISARSAGSAG